MLSSSSPELLQLVFQVAEAKRNPRIHGAVLSFSLHTKVHSCRERWAFTLEFCHQHSANSVFLAAEHMEFFKKCAFLKQVTDKNKDTFLGYEK